MQEASGWIELGAPEKAIPIIERELPRMPPLDRLDASVFQSRLARAYAEAGYPDRASAAGIAACASTRATASARALVELSRVRQILIKDGSETEAPGDFTAEFDSLAEDMRAATGGTR
jgi:predicted Zn-dependent protease